MDNAIPRIPTPVDTKNYCYICWEGATEGDPLFRDCSCRGENGYAHTPCLISAAEARNKHNELEALTQPWLTCSVCKAKYSDPTRSQLIKAFNGERAFVMRIMTAAARLSIHIPMILVALCGYLMIIFLLAALVLSMFLQFGTFYFNEVMGQEIGEIRDISDLKYLFERLIEK